MRYFRFLLTTLLLTLSIISCSDNNDPPIQEVLSGNRGATLRTVAINSGEFNINDSSSEISILIEENDIENGDLLSEVRVFAQFVNSEINNSSSEVLVETALSNSFIRGGLENLPQYSLNYSLEEILQVFTDVSFSDLNCKDQINLRIELELITGQVFSSENLNAIIAGEGTFFDSPFCYTINIVEPLSEDQFTGNYLYQSIIDGPFGPSFGNPNFVTITNGHSSTVRNVEFTYTLAEAGVFTNFEFSIVCDEVIVTKLLFAGEEAVCAGGGGLLFGPDSFNATVAPSDDTVFEVQFVEGFRGFNGQCGFENAPSRIRFTKQ